MKRFLGLIFAISLLALPANAEMFSTIGGGSGNVVGPASATDNAIVRFDATTGKLVQNSGAIIADTGDVTFSSGAGSFAGVFLGNYTLAANAALAWTNTNGSVSASQDTFLLRDAGNVLAQRNGTNAQTFSVYNTFTDASNYERLNVKFQSNTATISAQSLGTGTSRALQIGTIGSSPIDLFTNNIVRWEIGATGHLIAFADNTYDIGASGATRPRSGYFGTDVRAPSFWIGPSFLVQLSSPSTGVMLMIDQAGTSFSRLQFGGTSASFPSIKRNATALNFRLADDSADAPITSADITSSGLVQAATTLGISTDVLLARDAANVLALRNGVNAQTFRIYNTTDAPTTNYERANLTWAANEFYIQTLAGGTGGNRNIKIFPAGTLSLGANNLAKWVVGTSGDMQATGAFALSLVNGLTLTAGALGLPKMTASASAPGATGGKLELVCGTNAGSAKLVAYAGTSATAVTVLDNIGSGVTGC